MFSSNDEYEENQTPSPGLTYNTLLNDSEDEGMLKISKYSEIETEKHDQSEILMLRSENQLLKAQIEIIQKEKEIHIRSNAQEKVKFDKNLYYLQNTLELELMRLKKENQSLACQNKVLIRKQQKREGLKGDKGKFYKMQVEKLEKHYLILINDKDRVIAMLKNELDQQKTKKEGKKNGSNRSNILSQDFSSTRASYSSFFPSPRKKLDNISRLIGKLEKEQSVIKESAVNENELNETEFNFKSLKELGERNKERFNSLQTDHKAYIMNRLNSKF